MSVDAPGSTEVENASESPSRSLRSRFRLRNMGMNEKQRLQWELGV